MAEIPRFASVEAQDFPQSTLEESQVLPIEQNVSFGDSQSGVIYDGVNPMAVDIPGSGVKPTSVEIACPPIDQVVETLQEPVRVPDIFKRNFDDEWEYKPMGRIQERIEWLGAKKDNEGKVIGTIMGSVVGRTGKEIVHGHPGNVYENMIEVSTYIRWDPENPNEDLLHIEGAICELILGDTGLEVKITTKEQKYIADGREYSGWIKKKSQNKVI